MPAPHRRRRVPPGFFGIAFGLAGLTNTWHAAGPVLGIGEAVPNTLAVVTAVLWLALLAGFAAQGAAQMLSDLRDPVLSPFLSLPAVTGLLLGVDLSHCAYTAGRVVVVVFLVVTLVFGGLLTGQWIVTGLQGPPLHPGYFLPTVAGGLVSAIAAAEVGYPTLAKASFGIGVVCWFLLGSVILNRLFLVTPQLPAPLMPTLAIELAPPAVAGIGWFALTDGSTGTVSAALGGYAVLMALVQVRLIPVYARLPFSPGFWGFTFSYAAFATDAVLWLRFGHPAGARALTIAVLVLITGFIAVIAFRTVRLALSGRLLLPLAPPQVPQQAAQAGPPADHQRLVP